MLNPWHGPPGRTTEKWYGLENAHERLGVPPERIIDYLALVGDTADNGGDGDDAVVTIAYNAVGFVKRIVDPDGVALTREYDWANRRVTQHLDPTGAERVEKIVMVELRDVEPIDDALLVPVPFHA